jgi:hypothetical protein
VISKRLWVAQAVWLSVLCSASCCPTPPAVALAMGGGGGDGGGLDGTIPATEWCQMRARPNTASTEPSKSYAQAPQPMTIDQPANALRGAPMLVATADGLRPIVMVKPGWLRGDGRRRRPGRPFDHPGTRRNAQPTGEMIHFVSRLLPEPVEIAHMLRELAARA